MKKTVSFFKSEKRTSDNRCSLKKKECDKFGVETNEDEKRFVPKRDTGRRVEFDGRHAQKKTYLQC